MSCRRDRRPKGTKRATRVLEFDLGPENGKEASSIIVGRNSGGTVAKDWYADKTALDEGIPVWARGHLDDYRRLFNDDRRAKAIVGIRIRSAFVPSPPSAAGFLLSTDSGNVKGDKSRAMNYTKAVEDSLKAAPDVPVIVSIGADGFACSSGMIKAFMERTIPYRLVMRYNFVLYPQENLRLTEFLLMKDKNAWWRSYDSRDILYRLRMATTYGVTYTKAGGSSRGYTDVAFHLKLICQRADVCSVCRD